LCGRLIRKKQDAPKGAKPLLQTTISESTELPSGAAAMAASEAGPWYALWTHSHCEQLVHDQLVHKGFSAFLPKVDVWSRRRGTQRLINVSMFPSYLFLRHALDKAAYLEVNKVRGLVRVLGERWDRLEAIPESEMNAIERVVTARQRVLPYPYLKEGQRARITGGPLTGVEGVLVETKPSKGLLVISVHLLQRSVAIVVDGTDVVPA
jgi:transcription antitermination factor NusG